MALASDYLSVKQGPHNFAYTVVRALFLEIVG